MHFTVPDVIIEGSPDIHAQSGSSVTLKCIVSYTIERPQSEAVASMAIDAASLITENGQVSTFCINHTYSWPIFCNDVFTIFKAYLYYSFIRTHWPWPLLRLF